MNQVVIFGATSAIAVATAKQIAIKKRDARFLLIARNLDRVKAVANDLKVRFPGVEVHCLACDALDYDKHVSLPGEALARIGGVDLLLVAHGSLGDSKASAADFSDMRQVLEINFIGAVSVISAFADLMEKSGSGTIAAISSVAGDRGRQSNYIYGSAKAGLSTFLSGLRNRLAPVGVRVLTVKPGFVDTPMTASFKKGALWAKPDQIGHGIVRAVEEGKDIVYLPAFWCFIMFIIRSIPERIFKRLRL